MKNKTICFIARASINRSTEAVIKLNEILYRYFSDTFDNLVFLDVSKVFTTALRYGGYSDVDAYELLPKNFKIVCPKNLSGFKKFLQSSELVAISSFSEDWYDSYIHYYIRKYRIPLLYIHTTSIIANFQYNDSPGGSFLASLYKKMKFLPYRFFNRFIRPYILAPVDTLFISEKDKALKYRQSKIANRYKGTEIVLTNSRFYDIFMSQNHKVSEDYVVFLDSIIPYSGDQINFGYLPIDRELYYKNLTRVLDMIGSILGKEVVICLSPKYNDDNLHQDFGGLKTVKHRTQEFVAKAELVLFHETSAINSAVVYDKKVIQLIGSRFNDFTKNNCEAFQKLFSFTTIDIFDCDEDSVREALRTAKINREKYDAYISNRIIASGQKSLPSFVQIADYISHKYGVSKLEC